jgi:hypothetical protein
MLNGGTKMDELDAIENEVLVAVLDTVLPPNGELPGAGALGLADRVRAGAQEAPHLGGPAARALSILPVTFASRSPADREVELRAREVEDPVGFGAIINLIYNAYYTDERVLKGIEARTNYTARPPQPAGYHLAAFDESVLAVVRQREPFWREV